MAAIRTTWKVSEFTDMQGASTLALEDATKEAATAKVKERMQEPTVVRIVAEVYDTEGQRLAKHAWTRKPRSDEWSYLQSFS